jgi:hypothetical protein
LEVLNIKCGNRLIILSDTPIFRSRPNAVAVVRVPCYIKNINVHVASVHSEAHRKAALNACNVIKNLQEYNYYFLFLVEEMKSLVGLLNAS